MRSTPSPKFPQRCLWNSSNVRLIDDGPLSSFQGRSSSASPFHASLLQAIGAVLSLALCPQVVSQAPCEGCFSRHCVCSVVSLHTGMFKAVHPQECSKVDVDYWHIPVWASHSTFVSSSLNLWERWHVWSDCHLWRQSSGGHCSPGSANE